MSAFNINCTGTEKEKDWRPSRIRKISSAMIAWNSNKNTSSVLEKRKMRRVTTDNFLSLLVSVIAVNKAGK